MVDEAQQKTEQLVRWLDELDREVPAQFESLSWKIGWFIVKLLKAATLRPHPPADSYRINEILREYRRWRGGAETPGCAEHFTHPAEPVEITLLAGCLGVEEVSQRFPWAGTVAEGHSVQLLRFLLGEGAGPAGETAQRTFQVTQFTGCHFPGCHQVVASALLQLRGRILVALSSDLLSLGVGLLANYHFGRPLYLAEAGVAAQAPAVEGVPEPGWDDSLLADPAGEAWRQVLAPLALQVPAFSSDGSELAQSLEDEVILPAAESFARQYSLFHHRSGRGR